MFNNNVLGGFKFMGFSDFYHTIREAPDGVFGSREIGGKKGGRWENCPKNFGRWEIDFFKMGAGSTIFSL